MGVAGCGRDGVYDIAVLCSKGVHDIVVDVVVRLAEHSHVCCVLPLWYGRIALRATCLASVVCRNFLISIRKETLGPDRLVMR